MIKFLFKQITQSFGLEYFLSDSESGIRIQMKVALILNLLFTVLHEKIREAEEFSTVVRVATKNLNPYVSRGKFLVNREAYYKEISQNELNKA